MTVLSGPRRQTLQGRDVISSAPAAMKSLPRSRTKQTGIWRPSTSVAVFMPFSYKELNK